MARAFALAYLPLGRWNRFGLAVGFGAGTAIGWKVAEYHTFIRNSPELATAYTDTLSDLLLSATGSAIAAGLVAAFTGARSSEA